MPLPPYELSALDYLFGHLLWMILAGIAVSILFSILKQRRSKKALPFAQAGLAHHRAGNLDAAIAEYGKALEFHPKSTDVLMLRGDAHKARGEFDNAIADYSKIINIDAKNAPALIARGAAFEAKRLLPRAIDDYTRAIKSSKAPVAYFMRANAYMGSGEMAPRSRTTHRQSTRTTTLRRPIRTGPSPTSARAEPTWLKRTIGWRPRSPMPAKPPSKADQRYGPLARGEAALIWSRWHDNESTCMPSTSRREKIRVTTYDGPGADPVMREVPWPGVPPKGALIQIAACGVCGTDQHILKGALAQAPALALHAGARTGRRDRRDRQRTQDGSHG